MINLPPEPHPLDKLPLDEQHFSMLCLAIEKAHALHVGSSGRLLMNFEIRAASSHGHLPRIRPLNGGSFIIDPAYLRPSPLYLYYDPDKVDNLPLLAEFDKESNRFVAASKVLLQQQDNVHNRFVIPIATLSALRGLQYIKDVVCLQMHEIDFDSLFEANAELAGKLRSAILEKFGRFYDFDAIADKSAEYEAAAKRFLDRN